MEYGCEVKLQQVVAENENGKKVITVESVAIIKVNSYTEKMTGKLYAGGNVEVLALPSQVKSKKLIDLIISYIENFDRTFLNDTDRKAFFAHDIIRALKLSSEDKYKFLLMSSDEHRENFIIRQIEYLMLIRNQEKMLDDDFHLN